MMELTNYVVRHGVKISNIFRMIDLKKKNEGRYFICIESKTKNVACTHGDNPFQVFQKIQLLYSFKKRKDLENLNELVSLQNQVKALRIKDKLGKQNFHEDMK